MGETLTQAQRDEAQTLVKYVLDKGGEAVLETSQKLLLARYAAALSAVPEDVSRRPEWVALDVAAIEPPLMDGVSWSSDADKEHVRACLSRLASAAARVPGLEAQVANLTACERGADAVAGEALAAQRTAESERAAARKQRDEALDDAERFRAQTDAARQEVAEALAARNHWQEQCAKLERQGNDVLESIGALVGFDSDAVLAERLAGLSEAVRAALAGRDSQVEQLREQVATLEREKAEVEKERDAAQPAPAPGLREAVGKALERADAAVQELRDWDQTGPTDGGFHGESAVSVAGVRDALGEASTVLRAAYDAAPDATVKKPETAPVADMEQRRAEWKPAVDRAFAFMKERDEKAAKWDAVVGRASRNHRVVSHYLNAGGGQVQPGAMRETVRWLLHGDGSGTDAAPEALPKTSEKGALSGLLTLLAQPTTDTLLRVETEGGNIYSLDGAELHEMAEKAAKWDAAVVRAKDAEILNDAWDRIRKAQIADGFAFSVAIWDFARWLLGLDAPTGPGGGKDAQPCEPCYERMHGRNPRTPCQQKPSCEPTPRAPDDALPKARVAEALRSNWLKAEDAADELADAETEPDEHARLVRFSRGWVESIAGYFGLTLDAPTGPGGGEASPNTPETVDVAREAVGLEPAPTHTPTGQALKPLQALVSESDRLGWSAATSEALRDLSQPEPVPVPMPLSCPACGAPHKDEDEWATRPHKTHQCQSCKHEWRPYDYPTVGVLAPSVGHSAQPEPAAPEVVWEWPSFGGWRVTDDGKLWQRMFSVSSQKWVQLPEDQTEEVEEQVAVLLARALAEATREKRKAAEDMRERCALAVLSGPVDETPTRGELAARIRALPLESK